MEKDYCGYLVPTGAGIVIYQEFIHTCLERTRASGSACMACAKALPGLENFAIIRGFPEACGVPGSHREVLIAERTSGRDMNWALSPLRWAQPHAEKSPLY
jgi:hypothetical protein